MFVLKYTTKGVKMKKIVTTILFLSICFYAYSQTNHSGVISTDETWYAADNPHVCTGDVTVSSTSQPTLTLEPGVIVKFNAGKRMSIGNTSNPSYAGGLIAVGTEDSMITFTSNSATPAAGDWDYIEFRDNCIDANCQIEYAILEYGGLASDNCGLLIDNTAITVNNVTFQYNSGAGVKLDNFINGSQRPDISNSSFIGNTDYPIRIYANDLFALGAGNTFSGNGTDEVYVYGERIYDDQTWLNQEIPYFINNDINLYEYGGVTLNINYGSVLKFNAEKDFTVGYVSDSDLWGTLNATGVEFIGSVDTTGYWDGLIFNNYSHGGTLSGCTIKNAGSGHYERSIFISTNQSVIQQTITGCHITDGLGDGLYIDTDSRPTVSGNTISGNTGYPISIHANDAGSIGPNNDLTGNGFDVIRVRGGTIDESQIWNNHGVPYLLTNDILIYGSANPHLQIMPGCIIQLKDEDYIQVGYTSNDLYPGSMEAEGVTFTRANVGDIHRGIYFARFCDDANSILTDCIVEYGGYASTYNAGVIITQSAPTLNHVTFRNNDGFGLRINDINEGNPLPEVTNCRFYDNQEHPIKVHASDLSCLKEDNIYSGNNPERIYVTGDRIYNDAEWINQGIPYDIYGDITVWSDSNPHLIINSGITLMFGTGEKMGIGYSANSLYSGSLEANGVTFTGKTETPGDWTGLIFYRYINNGLCELDKCKVEYAVTNISCDKSSPLIKQCVIANALNHGIETEGSLAVPNIYKNSIYDNDIGIYCSSSADPLIGGDTGNANSIYNNTSYGVQNTSTSVTVDATYNWWGDATGPYNATTNPDGLGNPVSDYVDYADFLTTALAEAPSLFDLLSPENGDTLWSFDSVLDWAVSIDPTPNDTVKYRLELSTTDNYLSVFTDTINNIESSEFLLSEDEIDDDTRYWWKVTAYDLIGLETNSNQQDWYFDVFVIDPPNDFSLISPLDDATVSETSVLLTWNAAIDPDPGDNIQYTVYLDETAAFSDPDSAVTVETGVYTPFCEPGNLFYWTVKATDSYGLSTYSGVRSFYVDPSAGPRPPAWVTITKNGNDFDLSWEVSPGSDNYTIQHSSEPYTGFTYLGSSDTNSYTHVDAAQTYAESYYRIVAIDDDLILFWRDLSGNRLE